MIDGLEPKAAPLCLHETSKYKRDFDGTIHLERIVSRKSQRGTWLGSKSKTKLDLAREKEHQGVKYK